MATGKRTPSNSRRTSGSMGQGKIGERSRVSGWESGGFHHRCDQNVTKSAPLPMDGPIGETQLDGTIWDWPNTGQPGAYLDDTRRVVGSGQGRPTVVQSHDIADRRTHEGIRCWGPSAGSPLVGSDVRCRSSSPSPLSTRRSRSMFRWGLGAREWIATGRAESDGSAGRRRYSGPARRWRDRQSSRPAMCHFPRPERCSPTTHPTERPVDCWPMAARIR